MDTNVKVVITEHERGWGSRVDEVKSFASLNEAEAYCDRFNSQNTEATVPDWYMVARVVRHD